RSEWRSRLALEDDRHVVTGLRGEPFELVHEARHRCVAVPPPAIRPAADHVHAVHHPAHAFSLSRQTGSPPACRAGLVATVVSHVPPFRINPAYSPVADQPKASAELAGGVADGDRFQTLLGVTGSGKTATMAFAIEKAQRPA